MEKQAPSKVSAPVGIAALGEILAREQLQMGKTVSYCESMFELSEISAKRIADCAKKGYADAAYVYEVCGRKLGQGLAVLIDILNPEMIVLGSIYQRSGELMKCYLEEALEKESLVFSRNICRIVPAALGENIGDYAALSTAAMNREVKHE